MDEDEELINLPLLWPWLLLCKEGGKERQLFYGISSLYTK